MDFTLNLGAFKFMSTVEGSLTEVSNSYARINHLLQRRKPQSNAQIKYTINLVGPHRGRSPMILIMCNI